MRGRFWNCFIHDGQSPRRWDGTNTSRSGSCFFAIEIKCGWDQRRVRLREKFGARIFMNVLSGHCLWGAAKWFLVKKFRSAVFFGEFGPPPHPRLLVKAKKRHTLPRRSTQAGRNKQKQARFSTHA